MENSCIISCQKPINEKFFYSYFIIINLIYTLEDSIRLKTGNVFFLNSINKKNKKILKINFFI